LGILLSSILSTWPKHVECADKNVFTSLNVAFAGPTAIKFTLLNTFAPTPNLSKSDEKYRNAGKCHLSSFQLRSHSYESQRRFVLHLPCPVLPTVNEKVKNNNQISVTFLSTDFHEFNSIKCRRLYQISPKSVKK
jgi:hypothetical protein